MSRAALASLCLAFVLACGSKPAPQPPPPPPDRPTEPVAKPEPAPSIEPIPATKKETFAADTPKTTVAGNAFIAPSEWSMIVKGTATILEAPEGDSRIAFVDVKAKDADEALKLAWAAYKPDMKWPLQVSSQAPDKDGWTKITTYAYQTSPNEKRFVAANTRFANEMWTVTIIDMSEAVGGKRGGQLNLLLGQLLPKGFERESFAGKKANKLDKAKLDALATFVQDAQQALRVPGISIGVIQDGKVILATGYGVRELGKPGKVDADTKYIIASNTKALTTLMLAKLVDEKKLTWDTPATQLLPEFKLGDADTTSKVQVKHLICACTGLPRQDMEWIFEFGKLTPETALASLAKMQPTSKFGELFQYSNPMAAAAGYLGGHVAFPKLPLGKAYDEAMRTRVFEPLGMTATTFDFAKAQRGNYSRVYALDFDDKPALAAEAINRAIIPVRPAGGAWSNVRDVLKYVQMELDDGKLPATKAGAGKQYISKEALLARRAPQVAMGKDMTYGMGLMVSTRWNVTVVAHGGDIVGFHSDMLWLPEHGVGAVILVNGDSGASIRGPFRRKLLELLFDGKPEADADIAATAKRYFEERAAERKLLVRPADPAEVGKLAAKYASPELGDITVVKKGTTLMFDFGEWKSEMASKKNPDGTTSFVTISPSIEGIELVAGTGEPKTLILRDAQHEYVFTSK